MTHVEELRRENRALKDRFARLSGAVLRISSSLDLDTVLQEVIDGARALTGSRKGIITTIDGRGRLVDFLSSGFTPEVLQELVTWPEGPRFFEHLRDLSEPFRQADVPAYLTSLDLPVAPWFTKTMQGAPMHHRGEHLGHFFLGDKENDETYTGEDGGDHGAVRFAGRGCDRQRAHAPRRATRTGGPGGPGRDLAVWRGGVRPRHRSDCVDQPRGAPHGRGDPHAGLPAGAAIGGADVPT